MLGTGWGRRTGTCENRSEDASNGDMQARPTHRRDCSRPWRRDGSSPGFPAVLGRCLTHEATDEIAPNSCEFSALRSGSDEAPRSALSRTARATLFFVRPLWRAIWSASASWEKRPGTGGAEPLSMATLRSGAIATGRQLPLPKASKAVQVLCGRGKDTDAHPGRAEGRYAGAREDRPITSALLARRGPWRPAQRGSKARSSSAS
jgi:hypothetical protein